MPPDCWKGEKGWINVSGQWLKQLCQCNEASAKTPKDRFWRASRLVNTWEIWGQWQAWRGQGSSWKVVSEMNSQIPRGVLLVGVEKHPLHTHTQTHTHTHRHSHTHELVTRTPILNTKYSGFLYTKSKYDRLLFFFSEQITIFLFEGQKNP